MCLGFVCLGKKNFCGITVCILFTVPYSHHIQHLTNIYTVFLCSQYLVILSYLGQQKNTFCSLFEINQGHVASSGQSHMT